MQFKSELMIREAWRIVASGHEQWEQTGTIEPEHLATVRTVQIDMAQHLARFEDGPRPSYSQHGVSAASCAISSRWQATSSA